jgi:hypothetical protein
MKRRFGVPSMQRGNPPRPRIQHLPDDFAAFIPSGLVRRIPPPPADPVPAPAASPCIDLSPVTPALVSAVPAWSPSSTETSTNEPAPASDSSQPRSTRGVFKFTARGTPELEALAAAQQGPASPD